MPGAMRNQRAGALFAAGSLGSFSELCRSCQGKSTSYFRQSWRSLFSSTRRGFVCSSSAKPRKAESLQSWRLLNLAASFLPLVVRICVLGPGPELIFKTLFERGDASVRLGFAPSSSSFAQGFGMLHVMGRTHICVTVYIGLSQGYMAYEPGFKNCSCLCLAAGQHAVLAHQRLGLFHPQKLGIAA